MNIVASQETVDQRRIQREISILRRLTHGCIIQLLEIVETEHYIFLVNIIHSYYNRNHAIMQHTDWVDALVNKYCQRRVLLANAKEITLGLHVPSSSGAGKHSYKSLFTAATCTWQPLSWCILHHESPLNQARMYISSCCHCPDAISASASRSWAWSRSRHGAWCIANRRAATSSFTLWLKMLFCWAQSVSVIEAVSWCQSSGEVAQAPDVHQPPCLGLL